jgi:hypothetical protein
MQIPTLIRSPDAPLAAGKSVRGGRILPYLPLPMEGSPAPRARSYEAAAPPTPGPGAENQGMG